MGNGPILLAGLLCSGLEESLLDCNRNTFGTLNCAHFEDAGVTCESKCNLGTIQCKELDIFFNIQFLVLTERSAFVMLQ